MSEGAFQQIYLDPKATGCNSLLGQCRIGLVVPVPAICSIPGPYSTVMMFAGYHVRLQMGGAAVQLAVLPTWLPPCGAVWPGHSADACCPAPELTFLAFSGTGFCRNSTDRSWGALLRWVSNSFMPCLCCR